MKMVVDKFQALGMKYFMLQTVNLWHLLLQETVEKRSIGRLESRMNLWITAP